MRKNRKQQSILALPFGSVDHCGHDRHEFIGFLFQRQSVRRNNPTFFTQKFKPKRGFVGFLKRAAQLGDKLLIGSRAGGFSDLGCDGCARAQQLPSKHMNLVTPFGELDK
jgi:hypothetical protein